MIVNSFNLYIMKLKTSNPTVLAVAKYYGFTTHGKFAAWLHSMCPCSRVCYWNDEGAIRHIRVARLRHMYFYTV